MTAKPSDGLHRHSIVDTRLGRVYLATDGQGLTGSWIEGQKRFATAQELGHRVDSAVEPVLDQAHRELTEYLHGERTEFEVPVNPAGTDFQLAVWQVLGGIEFGHTTTYGAISKFVGPHAPAQAVGQAVGRNRCLIFIPCHRVVAADGKITGYAAGLEVKQALLELESSVPGRQGQEGLF